MSYYRDSSADTTAAEIARRREALKPTPVEPEVVPAWLIQAIKTSIPKDHEGADLGESELLPSAFRLFDVKLDHWGTTWIRDREVFVSEPYYPDPGTIANAQKIARWLGCDFFVDPTSWHFPGETTRLAWAPRYEHQGIRP